MRESIAVGEAHKSFRQLRIVQVRNLLSPHAFVIVEETPMQFRTLTLSLLGLAAAISPAVVNADSPGRHPAYLRARSDLRAAQFLLRVRDEPNVTRRLVEADREIEAAVREVDRAAVLDRKDLEDHPRVDTNLARKDRFRKIVELLRSARADLGHEEDNGAARGWRDAAYGHIDQALEHMHRAAVDLHWDHEFGF
jgi:hypothetical protein